MSSAVGCRTVRPTCEVVGSTGGFIGEGKPCGPLVAVRTGSSWWLSHTFVAGVKTIVPAKAFAKVVCRLVPDQEPDVILAVSPCVHFTAAALGGSRALAFH